MRAPTTSGGTTFGPGTANNLLKSNGTSIYWTTLTASDIPNLSTDKLNSGTLGTNHGGTGVNSHTANRLVWSKSATELQAASHYVNSTKIGVNYTSDEPSSNFYVNGTSIFNIGTDDSSSKKHLYILGNSRLLSLGAQGLQAYTRSGTTDTAGLLYIQYQGGNIEVGSTSTATATRTLYGVFEFKSANGFNYSGIAAGSDNAARTVWFSYNGRNGQPVYDNDFKYNPSTNVLTIGKLTITGGTANSSLDTSGTMTISSGSDKTLSLISNSTLYLNSAANTSIIFTRGGADSDHELARFDASGHFVPKSNSSYTIGTSSLKWSNIYATTFTGDLTGDVTGNVSGTAANVTGIIAISHGGTGATSDKDAIANLGSIYIKARGTQFTNDTNIDSDYDTPGTYFSLDSTHTKTLAGKLFTTDSGFKMITYVGYRSATLRQFADAAGHELYYRSSQNTGSTWTNWHRFVLLPSNDNQEFSAVGSSTTPVYVTSGGIITEGTALKALAYKDNLVASDIPDISGTYLKVSGGTISGNLTTQKFIHPTITGTGTAAVAYNASTSTNGKPALWKFDLSTATPAEGDIITITVPVAGHNNGVFVSTDNGTTYKPVSTIGASRLTTHYGVGTTITLVYDENGSTNTVYPVAGAAATTNVTGGCWRVLNYYDSNTTYSVMSKAEAWTGTATSSRVMRADYLKQILANLGGTGLSLTHNATDGIVLNLETVSIENGGTGATSASGARTNLGLGTMATENAANYLKLSGGTMTPQAGSWWQQRDLAVIKTTTYSESPYYPLIDLKTTNGDWAYGVYTNDTIYFNYISDSIYSSGSNPSSSDYHQFSLSPTTATFSGINLVINGTTTVSGTQLKYAGSLCRTSSLVKGTNPSNTVYLSNHFAYSSAGIATANRVGGGFESFVDKNGSTQTVFRNYRYASGTDSHSSLAIVTAQNGDSSVVIVPNSGSRAYLNLAPSTDAHSDIKFSRAGTDTWALSARSSSDKFFGLYNHIKGNWPIKVSETDNLTTFSGEIVVSAQSTTTEGGQIRLAAAPSYESGQYSAILDVETSSFRIVSNNAARLWLNLTNGDLRVTGRLLPDNAVEVTRGGTGATTALAARHNLGIYETIKTGLAVSANGVTSFAVTDASVKTSSIILITTDTEKTYASVVVETGKYTIKVTNNNTTSKTVKAYVLIIY